MGKKEPMPPALLLVWQILVLIVHVQRQQFNLHQDAEANLSHRWHELFHRESILHS
jgi:hypothetical protein